LALADPGAFYGCATRSSRSIQIRFACARDFDLSARGELSTFHLDEKDAPHLAYLHFGNARRHRTIDGFVPLCADDDRNECRSLRHSFEEHDSASVF